MPEADLPIYVLLVLHKKMLKTATGCNVKPTPPFDNDLRYCSIRHDLHPEFEHRLEGAKRNDYQALQDKGVIVITTFKWHSVIEAATFWMSADIMDEMRASDEWCMGMWRTDNWRSVTTVNIHEPC